VEWKGGVEGWSGRVEWKGGFLDISGEKMMEEK